MYSIIEEPVHMFLNLTFVILFSQGFNFQADTQLLMDSNWIWLNVVTFGLGENSTAT